LERTRSARTERLTSTNGTQAGGATMISGTIVSATPGEAIEMTFNGVWDPAVAELPESTVSYEITAPLMLQVVMRLDAASDRDGIDAKRVGPTNEALRLSRIVAELQPDDPEAHGLLAFTLHAPRRTTLADPAASPTRSCPPALPRRHVVDRQRTAS
jgi:Flp pilus assembly protein TadD